MMRRKQSDAGIYRMHPGVTLRPLQGLLIPISHVTTPFPLATLTLREISHLVRILCSRASQKPPESLTPPDHRCPIKGPSWYPLFRTPQKRVPFVMRNDPDGDRVTERGDSLCGNAVIRYSIALYYARSVCRDREGKRVSVEIA